MYEVLFLSALALSLLFSGMPGSVNTEAIRNGLRGGFRPAAMIGLGALVGDLTWAFIALIGLAFLVTNDVARIILGIFGCALLLYLAYRAFLDAKKGQMLPAEGGKNGKPFLVGLIISLSSPLQVVFWLGIGGSTISVLAPDPGLAEFLVYFLGYVAGGLLWAFGLAALVAYGRRYMTDRLFRAINIISGVVMVYFALAIAFSAFAK
jgi:threonine/homoserine/homoserine lactone efflux protein